MSNKDLIEGAEPDREVVQALTRLVERHPIELEERIPTLKRPLIIECACPGWQPRGWPPRESYATRIPPNYVDGGVRYPAVPVSLADQAREITQAVSAGCAIAHVHPRDPETGERYRFSVGIANKKESDLHLLRQVYDRIFSETDVISVQHGWKESEPGMIDYTEDLEKMLEAGGGNRYCQGAVVLWPPMNSYQRNYTKAVQAGIRFMEANHVKPVHKLRSTYNVRHMWRVLVDTGVITEEPLILVHDMGHPYGWPMDTDPWMPIDLITSIEQTKRRMPNSLVGVFSGGRNWLLITLTAIMYGVDLVRVGIEDAYWMYPHEDEVIQRNMDCVRKVTDFCRIIGRKVATVDEARQIMGMTRTS